MFGFFRRRRRRRARERAVPSAWLDTLGHNVPFFARLPDADRARFLGDVAVFVDEKHFVGAGGLSITDEMRVTIAAAAVRLTLHLDISFYDRLTEIVVYPDTYRHPDDPSGAILGEAHHWGTVVLSWRDVLAGLRNERDGHNTAIHEFAHVLDRVDGAFNGAPELRASEHYRPWATVMSKHYAKLQKRDRRTRSVLRDYGAVNEAEFFAVATEAFFERPDLMRARAPDLHAELARFYGGDTRAE